MVTCDADKGPDGQIREFGFVATQGIFVDKSDEFLVIVKYTIGSYFAVLSKSIINTVSKNLFKIFCLFNIHVF